MTIIKSPYELIEGDLLYFIWTKEIYAFVKINEFGRLTTINLMSSENNDAFAFESLPNFRKL